MKIVHTEASCGWGGQEIRILEESHGMIQRGHEVVVLCPRESKIFTEGPLRGVPTEAMPIGRKTWAGFQALRNWLRQHQIDVINTHSSADSWLTALAAQTLSNAPPLIRTRHISPPISQNPFSQWLYTKAVRHVVTTGERLRDQVMRETGAYPENVTSIPTGVDLRRYCPGDPQQSRRELGLPESEKLLVGIVATLRSWKGHDHLFSALAAMNRPDVLLVVVGDGPRRAHLHALASQLALGDRVLFVGQQENVVPWFRALDLAVLPSYANEGVPQSLMQAMACGLPVISTPVGAIPELIRHGDTGWLVPHSDPSALARAISDLLLEPELRNRLGFAGRSFIEENYNIENMLNRMETVFRSAITQNL